ncbi:MAG: DUF2726 domain-containing protein [Piscinibacter sp.]|nr:DUF2726 domain-containing protein [Piscinibacter sp.]
MPTPPLTIALAALAGIVAASVVWLWWSRRPAKPTALPNDWALTARPVFSTDERRVYRLLREALPHHIVLSKLPLVRFSQPVDPSRVRYWYDLLGSIHVAFAVCSANGRVLAAIDLDTDRGNSRRVLQIKAVGARSLPRSLPALPGREPAFGGRAAVARTSGRRQCPRTAGRCRARAEPASGARHAGDHRGPSPRGTHRPVAGLVAVPGLLLCARHSLRWLGAKRVRRAQQPRLAAFASRLARQRPGRIGGR